MTIGELWDDMHARCARVTTFWKHPEDLEPDDQGAAALIRCSDESLLALEYGQAPSGEGYVTVRRFGADMEPLPVTVVDLDGNVMITI